MYVYYSPNVGADDREYVYHICHNKSDLNILLL